MFELPAYTILDANFQEDTAHIGVIVVHIHRVSISKGAKANVSDSKHYAPRSSTRLSSVSSERLHKCLSITNEQDSIFYSNYIWNAGTSIRRDHSPPRGCKCGQDRGEGYFAVVGQ